MEYGENRGCPYHPEYSEEAEYIDTSIVVTDLYDVESEILPF